MFENGLAHIVIVCMDADPQVRKAFPEAVRRRNTAEGWAHVPSQKPANIVFAETLKSPSNASEF